MSSKKRKKLEATIALIHRRWGSAAIRPGGPASPTAEIPHIPTSFADLDTALAGIGGIPRSRLTELSGPGTSGITTLALKVIANAQARRDYAAYVDLDQTFDPDYADRCEVKLDRLLVVRPENQRQGLDIVHTIVASRSVGVLVFDSVTQLLAVPGGAQTLEAGLSRLLSPLLAKSPCALIFLTPLPTPIADYALPHASVRLRLEREQWIKRRQDIRGYQVLVRVLSNKLGRAGRKATIYFTFNGTVRGDST